MVDLHKKKRGEEMRKESYVSGIVKGKGFVYFVLMFIELTFREGNNC